MPVRSLNLPVFRWPDADSIDQSIRGWVDSIIDVQLGVNCIGYFGSYARGDWGVGSDLDIIVILKQSALPFEQRGMDWDTLSLPVPCDLIIYTLEEWEELQKKDTRFYRMLRDEVVWIYQA